MPNFKTHALVGVGVAVTLNVVKQSAQRVTDPTREFDLGELLAWGAVGLVISSLPDILEPATHPNHRSTCHSFAIAALILYAIKGRHSTNFTEDQKDRARLLG